MKTLFGYFINFAFLALTIFACVYQTAGPLNLIYFLTWTSFILIFLVLFNEKAKKKMREKGPALNPKISCSFDFVMALVFAFYGHFTLASFKVFEGISVLAIYAEDENREAA